MMMVINAVAQSAPVMKSVIIVAPSLQYILLVPILLHRFALSGFQRLALKLRLYRPLLILDNGYPCLWILRKKTFGQIRLCALSDHQNSDIRFWIDELPQKGCVKSLSFLNAFYGAGFTRPRYEIVS